MSDVVDPDGAERPLLVRVRAWGASDAEADRALKEARRGWGRDGWDFGEPERLVGGSCPLDVHDHSALATHAGYGWAFTVHRCAGGQ